MNGDTNAGAAIYYYTNKPAGTNSQYEVNSPPGATNSGVIWLDGNTDNGTARSGNSFNLGPSVAVTLTGLVTGELYTINFDYHTEVNTDRNATDNTKVGPSGLIVSAFTSPLDLSNLEADQSNASNTQQSITTGADAGLQFNSDAAWSNASFGFTAGNSTEYVYFADDINPNWNNERWSSNFFLADVSLVPEISPLVMVGFALVGAIGVVMSRRRKVALS
jgi:hypothetical protein